MHCTSALLRVGARLLVLALTSFVLVALGCTGAQAFPETASPSVSSQARLQPAPVQAPQDVASPDTSEQEQITCIPGRDKARVEHNAIVPTIALFQHSPGANGATLPRNVPRPLGAEQLAGRIPAALTHLDLSIVRT